jgi:Flp pilus assembly protein TadG
MSRGMITASRKSLRKDSRGAALTEFALLLPVFALLLMGAMDAGHTLYMGATLQGAVQKAARDSGIETGMDSASQAAIDLKVKNQVLALNKSATVTFTRRYYKSFSATAQTMETYTDTNSNGVCDNNEPYNDDNNSGTRDAAGTAGSGSAKDSVLYTVNVSYPRMFPIAKIMARFWPTKALSQNVSLTASTVMNNQPFGDQAAPSVGHCLP